MSDYDEWDGEIGGSVTGSSHASHKPLKAPTGKRAGKDEGKAGIEALRDIVGVERVEPKRIDTTSIEEELKEMKIIDRGE